MLQNDSEPNANPVFLIRGYNCDLMPSFESPFPPPFQLEAFLGMAIWATLARPFSRLEARETKRGITRHRSLPLEGTRAPHRFPIRLPPHLEIRDPPGIWMMRASLGIWVSLGIRMIRGASELGKALWG